MTPDEVPSPSMAWISSSVTGLPLDSFTPSRRKIACVEADSSTTNGLVAMASRLMGLATRRANGQLGIGRAIGTQLRGQSSSDHAQKRRQCHRHGGDGDDKARHARLDQAAGRRHSDADESEFADWTRQEADLDRRRP